MALIYHSTRWCWNTNTEGMAGIGNSLTELKLWAMSCKILIVPFSNRFQAWNWRGMGKVFQPTAINICLFVMIGSLYCTKQKVKHWDVVGVFLVVCLVGLVLLLGWVWWEGVRTRVGHAYAKYAKYAKYADYAHMRNMRMRIENLIHIIHIQREKIVFLKGNKSSSHVLSGAWTVNLVQIYLSKVCIKSCFWIGYFIIIIQLIKNYVIFKEFVSKSVHVPKCS